MKQKKESGLPQTVKDLTPAPYNPRRISDQAGVALSFSMKEFGDLSEVVFNLKTRHLVSGHQRAERLEPGAAIVNYTESRDDIGTVGMAYIKEGKNLWPIRFVEWDELKEKAANIAANNPEIAGEFTEGLTALLAEIQAGSPDVYDQALLYKIKRDLAEALEEETEENLSDFDLSPLPYESYDYVVLLFRNAIDWTFAQEHFKLKTVKDISGGKQKIGRGRVVDGADYINKMVKRGS